VRTQLNLLGLKIKHWRSFALRLVLATGVLLGLVRFLELPLVRPLLPVLREIVNAVDERFDVAAAVIVATKSGRMIELKVRIMQPLELAGLVIPAQPDTWIPMRVLVANVLQPIVPLLAIIFAWPVMASWREVARRVGWCVPAGLLLLVCNVPLGFNAMMLDVRTLFPGATVPPLVYWNDFMQTGGNLVLPVGLAMLVIALSERRNSSSTGIA
jgi:hypothetical protein